MRRKQFISLVKQTFQEWGEDKASRLAAALAYYTVFSMPPLLLIAIAIAGRFFSAETAKAELTAQITELTGPRFADAVTALMDSASEPTGSLIAVVTGIVTLLLGASGVFSQLQDAMNTIWEVKPDPDRGVMGIVKARFFSFTMVLGIGFLLLVSLIVSALLEGLRAYVATLLPDTVIVLQVINIVTSFVIITLLFALIFKVVPDVEVAWSDVWIGAVVTALLFTIGKYGISVYLGRSSVASTYGAAGSLIIILLWIYYSAQILFLGAEFTQVYANRYGSRIVASEGAISLTPVARTPQDAGQPDQREQEETAVKTSDPYLTPAQMPPLPLQREMSTFHSYIVTALALVIGVWRWLRGR